MSPNTSRIGPWIVGAVTGILTVLLVTMLPLSFSHRDPLDGLPMRGQALFAQSTGQRAMIAKQLQTTATTGNGLSVGSAFMSNCRETAVYFGWTTGVNAGAATIESAVDENYTGTWSNSHTTNYNDSSPTPPKQDLVQITGVHWAIRARISTTVTGGTLNAWIVCN